MPADARTDARTDARIDAYTNSDPLVLMGVSGVVKDALVNRVKRHGKSAGLEGNYGGWIRIGAKTVQGWFGVTLWALDKIKRAGYPGHLRDIATTRQDRQAMLDVSDFDELAAGMLAPTRHMWFIVKE